MNNSLSSDIVIQNASEFVSGAIVSDVECLQISPDDSTCISKYIMNNAKENNT